MKLHMQKGGSVRENNKLGWGGGAGGLGWRAIYLELRKQIYFPILIHSSRFICGQIRLL
jgi:hypothetical protein